MAFPEIRQTHSLTSWGNGSWNLIIYGPGLEYIAYKRWLLEISSINTTSLFFYRVNACIVPPFRLVGVFVMLQFTKTRWRFPQEKIGFGKRWKMDHRSLTRQKAMQYILGFEIYIYREREGEREREKEIPGTVQNQSSMDGNSDVQPFSLILPGNSASLWPCRDGENVTLLRGCLWPPTFGDKKVAFELPSIIWMFP